MKPAIRLVGILAGSIVIGALIYGGVKSMYAIAQALALPPALTNLLPLGILALVWFIAMRLLKHFQRGATQESLPYDVEEKHREAWLQIKAMGKRRYVWRVGVLRWGLVVFAIWTPLMLMVGPRTHKLSSGEIAAVIIVSLFLWTVGGYVFGNWMWRMMESKYR